MRRYQSACDCGWLSPIWPLPHSAVMSGRAHDRDAHQAADLKADWNGAKMRYPATRGLTDQQWVDRWTERPELFERLVKAFVKVARTHPIERRLTDPDQVAI